MNILRKIGLSIFLFSMGLFIFLIFATRFEVGNEQLNQVATALGDKPYAPYVIRELEQIPADKRSSKFSYFPALNQSLNTANEKIAADKGVSADLIEEAVAALSQNGTTILAEAHAGLSNLLPSEAGKYIIDNTGWMIGREYADATALGQAVRDEFQKKSSEFTNRFKVSEGSIKDIKFEIVKATSSGFYWKNQYLYFLLVIGLGIFGGLLYILPKFRDGGAGVKHNGIYHNSSTNGGLIGILTGAFLIGFYILLYFYHFWIAEWITLVDPISQLITGGPASRWFMYGTLYTIAILVMGIRMFAKYRHSRYHQVRTISIMFFQTAFAYIIPEILVKLNQPYMDLKNSWPLNYTFFFDYNVSNHIDAGNFGIWMLGWGIALFLTGVPLFTYFYGKRWYCSWVCGCGGLAETLGDPYRQLSDKSLKAWKVERWLIHSVLVFAVVMTGLVLYTVFSKESTVLGLNSFTVRSIYGFAIGSVFAGVIGTGFYPFMGNRMWCRFGCPLAAYLGLVQRFKSQFRITTNGGQCISCGNCSTYCEMGIDVRAYAQRGQNIVRSSCVGCGVCAAVCPRGVLSLENMANDDSSRMSDVRY
ncbi:MAG: 4Fe-4S dicluster domain-containing protein [Bacteroidota bacterium]